MMRLYPSFLLLWVDGDDLSASAPDHQTPVQALGQHFQELHVCKEKEKFRVVLGRKYSKKKARDAFPYLSGCGYNQYWL